MRSVARDAPPPQVLEAALPVAVGPEAPEQVLRVLGSGMGSKLTRSSPRGPRSPSFVDEALKPGRLTGADPAVSGAPPPYTASPYDTETHMPAMYDASVPTFTRALSNLVHVLELGAAHAEAKKIDPAVLVGSRLYPDMFPLSRQVQIASDVAKIGTARLAQVEPPKWEDNEATFAELIERARKTIAYLQTLKPEQFDDGARLVTFPTQKESYTWPGARYLTYRVIPNVFFHCTTAYNILRHSGVEIGKSDFLGPLEQ